MPDINVLVYAHRSELVHHAFYRGWVERLASAPSPFLLSSLVAVGFVRVVTQPAFPGGPTPLHEALAVIDALRASAQCILANPGPRHWDLVATMLRATGATGKLVADAQHAALAVEHGATWMTRDGDFARFQQHALRWDLLLPPARGR